MIPLHLTRPQQVTTAESSPTTVRHRRRSASSIEWDVGATGLVAALVISVEKAGRGLRSLRGFRFGWRREALIQVPCVAGRARSSVATPVRARVSEAPAPWRFHGVQLAAVACANSSSTGCGLPRVLASARFTDSALNAASP
jgi:hypothetical protein